MATEVHVGRVRSLVLLIVFSVFTLGIYYFYWLYQVNDEFRKFLGAKVNPVARVLLFLLVPVVGWFFVAWLTARNARQIQVRVGASRPVSPIYPALFAALAPLAGWFVAAGYIQGGANRAWLRAAHVLGEGELDHSELECPDCSSRFKVVLNPVVPHEFACPTCQRAGIV